MNRNLKMGSSPRLVPATPRTLWITVNSSRRQVFARNRTHFTLRTRDYRDRLCTAHFTGITRVAAEMLEYYFHKKYLPIVINMSTMEA